MELTARSASTSKAASVLFIENISYIECTEVAITVSVNSQLPLLHYPSL